VDQVPGPGRKRKKKGDKGSVSGLIGLVASFLAFVIWALYIAPTFSPYWSLICLAFLLPIAMILIIMGIVFSSIALKLGAGKRKLSAIIGLVFSIVQVLLWIGWIIFTISYNINEF
jgi:hypothetical protein